MPGRRLGHAGPRVDLALPVDVQRERRAELPVVVEVGAERIGHLPVAVLHRAVDLRHPGDGSDAPRPATDRAPGPLDSDSAGRRGNLSRGA